MSGIIGNGSYAQENAAIVTIASGIATIQQGGVILAAESSTSDDLDRIVLGSNFTGLGSYGVYLMLVADSGDTITLKNGTYIVLAGGADFALTGTRHVFGWHDGTYFYDLTAAVSLSSSSLPVVDTTAVVKGSADATKLLRFEVDGFTTGTTRVLTPPNFDGTIATLAGTETFTNKTLTSPVISGGTIDNTAIGTTTRALGYFSALREYIGGFAAIFTHANSADRTYTFPDATTTIVGTDTTQTLTNKTLTAPKINLIADTNGNEEIIFTTTASAVNEITVTNAATAGAPQIAATGGDTNIDLNLVAKGTGHLEIDTQVIIDGDSDRVQLRVQANGTQSNHLATFENSGGTIQAAIAFGGGAIFNEQGNDSDFRVEGDTNQNLLFADAGVDAVGIGTGTPSNKTILDVVSTTRASRPFPTMDSTQRDAITSPATAGVIYNSTTAQFEWWNGSAWVALGAAGSTPLADFNGFRITPTTAKPVEMGNVSAATNLYWTPWVNNLISLYDGSSTWNPRASGELTLSLSGLTANTLYDWFIYDNAGTPTVDTPVAWSTATARATAIVRQDGRWVKSGATTRRYIGTCRINSTGGQVDWIPMPSAAPGNLTIWNMQNRVPIPFRVIDATDSWSYSTASWRQANASANNQMNVICGLAESMIDIALLNLALPNQPAAAAIGEDSTTARATENVGIAVGSVGIRIPNTTTFKKIVPLGYHYYARLEYGDGVGVTWYGDNGTSDILQSGMSGDYLC